MAPENLLWGSGNHLQAQPPSQDKRIRLPAADWGEPGACVEDVTGLLLGEAAGGTDGWQSSAGTGGVEGPAAGLAMACLLPAALRGLPCLSGLGLGLG